MWETPDVTAQPLDFVGVGAARCGTTWLARCLGEHPAIQLPDRKELHYFNNDRKYEPSLRWLTERFPEPAEGRLRGEFTPRYLLSETALDRIARHAPEAKILVLLREPVARAWSQYCYFRFNKKKEPEREFERALAGFYHEDYVEKGLYGRALERLFARFPRERVWIGRYETIGEEPERLLRSLFEFLAIDPSFRPPTLDRVVNASRQGRAEPNALWARSVRWLTYSELAPIDRYRGRLLAGVERINARFDAWGKPAKILPPDERVRQRIYERWFAEDAARAEALLGEPAA